MPNTISASCGSVRREGFESEPFRSRISEDRPHEFRMRAWRILNAECITGFGRGEARGARG